MAVPNYEDTLKSIIESNPNSTFWATGLRLPDSFATIRKYRAFDQSLEELKIINRIRRDL